MKTHSRLLLFAALMIHMNVNCMYTWSVPQFGGTKIQFPVQDAPVLVQTLNAFTQDEDGRSVLFDAIIHFAEPKQRTISWKNVYTVNRVTLEQVGTLPQGLEQQLYEDGLSLLCYGRFTHIAPDDDYAYNADNAFSGIRSVNMGQRMVVLALTLGAKPDTVLKDSQLALTRAWDAKNNKLVQLLLQHGVPIP